MNTEEIVREELDKLREDIIETSQSLGQKASGHTYEEILVEQVSSTGGQVTGPGYVEVLARGRRPGRVPYDFAAIIKEWAAYKGISFTSEEEFDRWANAVVWSIRSKGSELWREDGSQGEQTDVFSAPISRFEERIVRRLTADLYETTLKEIDIWQ